MKDMIRTIASFFLQNTSASARMLLIISFVFNLSDAAKTFAQYNTDRLITIGKSALYYEDYVLSIQYFNQAIIVKPWLYEPWFLRGVAKYNLDDFAGAESDCSEAIERNPYVVSTYELRALARIRLDDFSGAISDYNHALHYAPDNRGLWHNRVLCHIQNKEFDSALTELDTIQSRWSRYAAAYNMRADVYMQTKDTTKAVEALQHSLDIDPYDGHTWAAKSIISLSREQWKEAEEQLSQAIHLLPKNGGYHINRALARYNQNNLQGAMDDYDVALDLEPNNFLGHYNRGLLRAQVGDDNRAITDFDFVLGLEPDNMLALFNRGVLLDRTGDLRGAIRDYTKVIDEYPEFLTGKEYRARCYRKLGMTAKAETDEFAVYKARLYTHLYGPTKPKEHQRKRSDLDPEKYNQLVVEDEQEPEREYQSEYRGHVQNRKADLDMLPMFELSLEPQQNEVDGHRPFDTRIDMLNHRLHSDNMLPVRTIHISRTHTMLNSSRSADYFSYIDTLSTMIDQSHNTAQALQLLFVRAIAYTAVQDYQAAIDDLTVCLHDDSTSVSALWQRAVCLSRLNKFNAAETPQGTEDALSNTTIDMRHVAVIADLDRAISLDSQNPYLYYNRATQHVLRTDYATAIEDYSKALRIDPEMAEAYYNRGLCYVKLNRTNEGIADLSKAGEMGLYQAYSIIKRVRDNKQ